MFSLRYHVFLDQETLFHGVNNFIDAARNEMAFGDEIEKNLFGLLHLGIDRAPAIQGQMSLNIPLVSLILVFAILSLEFNIESEVVLEGQKAIDAP